MIDLKKRREISINSCPSDLAAGKRGSAFGVSLLANHFQQDSRFKDAEFVFAPIQNCISEGRTFPKAKYIEQNYHNLAATYHTVKEVIHNGRFCLNLLGDHSNAISTVSAASDVLGSHEIGLLWVDAHADMHSPYTTPSGNMHGMPLAALMGFDNKENMVNPIGVEEDAWWNRFKNIGLTAKSSKLFPQNLVIIGLRDYESQEIQLIKKYGIKYFTPNDISEYGIEEIVRLSLEHLSHCRHLLCSFDIDSMDEVFVKGTGTPVKDGLTPTQAKYIIDFVLGHNQFCSLDITEFNPTLDNTNSTFECVVSLFE
ncbi:MAG: arginase [Bacteroidetes bacterium]|nr:arginase [Bacteroidota bacterium]